MECQCQCQDTLLVDSKVGWSDFSRQQQWRDEYGEVTVSSLRYKEEWEEALWRASGNLSLWGCCIDGWRQTRGERGGMVLSRVRFRRGRIYIKNRCLSYHVFEVWEVLSLNSMNSTSRDVPDFICATNLSVFTSTCWANHTVVLRISNDNSSRTVAFTQRKVVRLNPKRPSAMLPFDSRP